MTGEIKVKIEITKYDFEEIVSYELYNGKIQYTYDDKTAIILHMLVDILTEFGSCWEKTVRRAINNTQALY